MAPLPDTQLLQGGAGRVLVRVTFQLSCPLGIGAASGARTLSQQVFNLAATPQAPSSYPVSRPEVEGGVFVIDFRVTKNLTVERYKSELEGLGGGILCKLRVTNVESIDPVEINQNQTTGATHREQTAVEAEAARQEATTTLGDVGRTAFDVFKASRGLVIAGVIGAILFATWPLITTGAKAGARLIKQKGD